MGQAVEQRRGQLGIDEDARPFGKDQVGRDDHAGVLVELRQQVKQERAARLGEGQVAEFVEDHEIQVHQLMGEAPGLPLRLFLLQRVDEFDRGVEAHAFAVPRHRLDAERRGQMRLAGAGAANQDEILRLRGCLLYTSPSPRDRTRSRMPSSA